MMDGLIALGLSLSVGAVAAINTAIASYYSLHPNPKTQFIRKGWNQKTAQKTMQGRVYLCMLFQFMAFFNSGVSLILLSAKLHWPFAIVFSALAILSSVVATYHLYEFFGLEWLKHVDRYHYTSVALCTVALALQLATPSLSTGFTVAAWGLSISTHIISLVYGTGDDEDTGKGAPKGKRHGKEDTKDGEEERKQEPKASPSIYAVSAMFLDAVVWACCAVAAPFLRGWSFTGWTGISSYIVCIVSAAEAVLLFGIGIKGARQIQDSKKGGSESDLEKSE
jgi:hypothetical protein